MGSFVWKEVASVAHPGPWTLEYQCCAQFLTARGGPAVTLGTVYGAGIILYDSNENH